MSQFVALPRRYAQSRQRQGLGVKRIQQHRDGTAESDPNRTFASFAGLGYAAIGESATGAVCDSALLRRARLLAQIVRGVDQADVAEGLRKIPQRPRHVRRSGI